jgi:membrane protein implicated in regulation of membrane protease activity
MNLFEKILLAVVLVLFAIGMIAMAIVIPEFFTDLFTWSFTWQETLAMPVYAALLYGFWRLIPEGYKVH